MYTELLLRQICFTARIVERGSVREFSDAYRIHRVAHCGIGVFHDRIIAFKVFVARHTSVIQ